MNWSIIANPKDIPSPGPVTNQDLANALSTTKASAQAIKIEKY